MSDSSLGRVPPPTPPHPRRRPLFGRALLIVRRVHLYLGLALFPWALLYGFTGILFNHPTLLAEARLARVAASGAELPTAERLAGELVAELAATSTRALTLQPGSARWEHDPSWRFSAAGAEHTVSRPLGADHALLRSVRRAPPPEDPLGASEDLRSGRAALQAATAAMTSLVQAHTGAAPGRVRELTPDLELTLVVDGQPCLARYDLREGKLACRALDQPRPLSWRSFLTRLHMTHGYPSHGKARLGWALVADLMGAALITWALTGLCMWVPMRGALRGWGLVALGLGAATAVALAVGMHQALTT